MNEMRIEFHDKGPDDLGRRHYSLHWMDDYFPGHPEGEYVRRERGQHFFGVPPGPPSETYRCNGADCEVCRCRESVKGGAK